MLMKNRKRNLVLLSIALVLSLLIGVYLYQPRTYYSMAYRLYENKIFFTLTAEVAKQKNANIKVISVNKDLFSEWDLYTYGVKTWTVSNSGKITVIGRNNIQLVAEPISNQKNIIWKCDFSPQQINIPNCSGRD